MSAQEFGDWIVYLQAEHLTPRHGAMRHAQVLAALSNGALNRKDGALWAAPHFMPPDPWSIQRELGDAGGPTPEELAAQIAAINASMR